MLPPRNLTHPPSHAVPRTDYSSRPENFQCLSSCRAAVCEALGLPEGEVELRCALG